MIRFFDDSELPLMDHEDDELVHRLRGLNWPEAEPGLKERGWEEFRQRMSSELPLEALDAGERFDYRRRAAVLRPTLAERRGGYGGVGSERVGSTLRRSPAFAVPRPIITL